MLSWPTRNHRLVWIDYTVVPASTASSRLPIGTLQETVISAEEASEIAALCGFTEERIVPADAEFSELKDGRGKLLIFTEHRDTLNYLRENLSKRGYTTCEIHGGMNPRERKHSQEIFRAECQICVATEAAGEGINLQFCHLMINYDMPWNPTRLEQRLGRIHRIGQERDCYAFNFVATDSEAGQPIIEGRILHRLLEKLDQMNDALEGRVFDVIGEVLSLNDINLPEILREVAYDPRRLDEYIDHIDRIDPLKLKQYEEATGIALARAHVDFSGFQRQNLEIEERRLMPRYVEAQFVAAAKEIGLRVEARADGLWRIEHVLADLRSDRLASARRFGKPETSYRKVTFHKEHLDQDAHLDAVLAGPGHALYAAVDEKLNERLRDLNNGIGVYVDPIATAPYKLHFFEMSIVGYQMECRLRCQNERKEHARICREYLEKSFEARINRAQERAMVLAGEAVSKSEYKLTADEAMRQVDELQRVRQGRMDGLGRLELARTGPVRHIASAVVVPPDAEIADRIGGWAVVWDPLSENPRHVSIHNPASKLDHAKREVIAARYYEIPAEAIMRVEELY